MKRCPECRRDYFDDSLLYCLDDGSALLEGPASVDEPATAILSRPGAVSTGFRNDEAPTKRQIDAVAEAPQPRNQRNKLLAITGIAALLLVGALLGYRYFAQPHSKQIGSIAVMPFVNDSGNADLEYLSDGLTESLITSLSQLPDLAVKARNSVFRYKGKEPSPQQVGRELNVQAIVNGRVVQRGNDLTLHIELVDVNRETALWSGDYNRTMNNLASLQGEIARDVSNKLQLKLSGVDEQRLAKTYTTSTEAYQLYLKGNYYLQNNRTEEALRKSIEFYRQAIEIDPNYALPYAAISAAYGTLSVFYIVRPQEAFAKSEPAALRALELDDKLAAAHSAFGLVKLFYEWDWTACEAEFRRAIELNPNYSNAHYQYAQYLVAMGRFDEAKREMNQAQMLDPLSPVINTTAGWIYYFARDYDEAARRYQKVLETDPEYFPPHRRLGMIYLQKKMYKEAIAQIEQSRSLSGESAEENAYLGYAYAVAGRRSDAEKVMIELQEQAKHRYVSPYLLALIYVGLDEKEQALIWLEKAYEDRSVNLIWLKVEPIFDGLRSDARFASMVKRLNLPD